MPSCQWKPNSYARPTLYMSLEEVS